MEEEQEEIAVVAPAASAAAASNNTNQYPIICNDDGVPVAFGTQTQYNNVLYCGRELGRDSIPGSDGKCGPANGPQCPSCQRLQRSTTKRWELLATIFPNLQPKHYVAALRRCGGSWTEAAALLRRLGCTGVPNNVAFPPHNSSNSDSDGGDTQPLPATVDSGLMAQVLEVVSFADPNAVKAALRRSNLNPDTAIVYMFDTPPDELARYAAEDEQRLMAHEVQQIKRHSERYETIQKVLSEENSIPSTLDEQLNLVQPQPEDVEPQKKGAVEEAEKQLTKARSHGHAMKTIGSDDDDDEEVFCVICATPVSTTNLSSYCTNCRLCDECVLVSNNNKHHSTTKGKGEGSGAVVFACPKMANGSHLHHHPLTLIEGGSSRRRNKCDVQATPNCKGRSLTNMVGGWYCQECDFDVCFSCIAHDIPTAPTSSSSSGSSGYHRRFGRKTFLPATATTTTATTAPTVAPAAPPAAGQHILEDSDSEYDSDEEQEEVVAERPVAAAASRPNFDHVAAERFSAAAWEGSLPEPPMGDIVVGTGVVGTTSPSAQSAGRNNNNNNNNNNRNNTTATNNRHNNRRRRASSTETTALGRESQQALKTLATFSTTAAASDGDDKATIITTACDAQLMEELLHRAEQMGEGGKTMKMLQEAVAAGNVAIAGALVLASDFAPKVTSSKRKRQEDDSEDGENSASGNNSNNDEDADANTTTIIRCFCGDAIDERGAVGCLNGHSMHPDCASDLMLGGGRCPTCRDPLFFPRVPTPEAKIAQQNAALEVGRLQQEEEDKMKSETNHLIAKGDYSFLNVGDIVRISSDVEFCSKEMMKQPGRTGWCSDLADSCGSVGRITQIIKEENEEDDDDDDDDEDDKVVAVKVRTEELGHLYAQGDNAFRCRKCRRRQTRSSTNPNACVTCLYCRLCKTCCETDASCPNSYHEWFWTPSVLTLVSRASGAALFHPSLANKDVALATEAEHHILRLRAELKAVSAGRATVQDQLEKAGSDWLNNNTSGKQKVSKESMEALRVVAKDLTPADQQRARHLLVLANQWNDSNNEVLAKKKLLVETIRAGDIDSAARFVRRHNAGVVADSTQWVDAGTMNREYIVENFSEVDLVAWPSPAAPKTGYKLKPRERFLSKQEWLDKTGTLWLQVDESSFVVLGSDGAKVSAVTDDRKVINALMGTTVVRGPDWVHGNQDGGGAGRVGTITSVRPGRVSVRWQSTGSSHEYRAGSDGKFDLEFSYIPPPPQGWLCTRPGGLGSPSVVVRGRSSLRCYSCGDGLVPPSAMTTQGFRVVKKEDKLRQGDKLLVAATLEPVEVVSAKGGKISCSFMGMGNQHQSMLPANASFTISYYPQDLVYPKVEGGDTTYGGDDVVFVDGQWRSRRELVLLFGNEAEAKTVWEDAKQRDAVEDDDKYASFPSCLKGHLLHARCFQGALLSGKCCPAKGCNEPLWQPEVRLLRSDGDTCCGRTTEEMDQEGEESAMANASELVGHSTEVRSSNGVASSNATDVESAGVARSLKMCPCCFSGPLFNTDCDDMLSHHGQCSVAAVGGGSCRFKASATDIASKLTQVSATKTVADVLPKCPTHNAVVMFNGCMSCGHLFTDKSWDDMPKWEPNAKAMLKLDKKKREAATILAKEIRRESGMLQYERDSLGLAQAYGSKYHAMDVSKTLVCLPAMPAPPEDFTVIGCGPTCNRGHAGEGNCLVCGLDWGRHSGHQCSDGRRGEWPLQ